MNGFMKRVEKLKLAIVHEPSGFKFILPDGSQVGAEDDYDPLDIITGRKTPPNFPVDYCYTGEGELDPISKAFMGTVIEIGKEYLKTHGGDL